ncbi:helix-turn-helix transcriptional regulator [Allomesorhizobium camelthorni]|uniref:WYL domain-containing protein n=1 Tax=Allomesorhizobium camelthorni TaxID=475069 RepID=A0A6G4W953_9HYPH|nr:WYL domain-containing protein [Mesorhizobium camelthorni]NGO51094.1 WYL domain-containing protein [Mesorhizobium camelthorni]
MSFEKARKLIELAAMVRAHRQGVTLDDVVDRFNVAMRTAQRMVHSLEDMFIDTESFTDELGRKRWRMRGNGLRDFLTVTAEQTAALEVAIDAMVREGATAEAAHLRTIRDVVHALVPDNRAIRIETDHEALLEAMGLLARPGPRPLVDDSVSAVVAEAIKGCTLIEFDYTSNDGRTRRRTVAPLGVLIGNRRYLVGRDGDDDDGRPKHFRMDRMSDARSTNRSFVRPEKFDVRQFAAKAFGVFEREDEFGEVVLRFSAEAASEARSYEFHPSQTVTQLEDGGLEVRFHASGHLEMAWHLYMWGDKVEVLAPERLRNLVGNHRRGDFPALP